MTDTNSRYTVQKHTIGGFFIGIILIVITYIADLAIFNLTFAETIRLHITSVPHIIVYLSPILLSMYAYFTTNRFVLINKRLEKSLQSEKIKTRNINDFVQQLISGKTDADYALHSDGDVLGQSMILLRNTLKKNREEEEKRKKEDVQRSWVNEGLAKFSEILRQETDNIEALSYKIISNLVNYTGSNQGGFFILNDEDENDLHFFMTACFAYDRKKFADKRVEWGEGLIGTCAQEKQTIYLQDIPETYVTITSGLGKATPKSLLVCPIKINDEVHGVLELATFREYEPYQVTLIEKVAESIASTLSSVKINERTAKLLKESREKAKALAENEEMMRQNMEELQAAQEEAALQGEKFIAFTNTVNHTLIRAEYATDGTLIYANTNFLKKLGYSGNMEVEGQHISIFINEKDKEWFFRIWEKLARGGKHFEGNMKHVTKQGKDLWTMATYTCMRRSDGTTEKILFLGLDVTEQKQQSLDFEGQLSALDRATIKAEFTIEGEFVDCNKLFLDTFDYDSMSDTEDKKVFDFIDRAEANVFKDKWKDIISGNIYQGIQQSITKNRDVKWLRVTYAPVKDMYEDIAKIIYLAQDITKEKLMEIESIKQTETLKKQEELLRNSEIELQRKLEKAKKEMRDQFKEIEKIKVRNELTLEGALDAILTFNEKGTIQFFNKAAEELWSISKTEIIGRSISELFSIENIDADDFLKNMVNITGNKIVGERKEVKITTKKKEDISVLFLLSEAKVGDEHAYTAFIQKIEVELF